MIHSSQLALTDAYIESNKNQQNTYSSHVHMEHSPGKTTYLVIKEAVINLTELKSCNA